MNAQDALIAYARQHNSGKTITDQQWIGQAIKEGIVIARTPESMTVASIHREGQTIIVTETVEGREYQVVDGKLVETKVANSTEVLRINV